MYYRLLNLLPDEGVNSLFNREVEVGQFVKIVDGKLQLPGWETASISDELLSSCFKQETPFKIAVSSNDQHVRYFKYEGQVPSVPNSKLTPSIDEASLYGELELSLFKSANQFNHTFTKITL